MSHGYTYNLRVGAILAFFDEILNYHIFFIFGLFVKKLIVRHAFNSSWKVTLGLYLSFKTRIGTCHYNRVCFIWWNMTYHISKLAILGAFVQIGHETWSSNKWHENTISNIDFGILFKTPQICSLSYKIVLKSLNYLWVTWWTIFQDTDFSEFCPLGHGGGKGKKWPVWAKIMPKYGLWGIFIL